MTLAACSGEPERAVHHVPLALEAASRDVRWGDRTALLDHVTFDVGDLIMKEPLGASFPGEAIPGGVNGAVVGAWDDTRRVELMGSSGGALGELVLYDGPLASAAFHLGSDHELVIQGVVQRPDDVVGVDINIDMPVEVRGVEVPDPPDPTASLSWTLDVAAVLAPLDALPPPWTAGTAGLSEILAESLTSPDVWTMAWE